MSNKNSAFIHFHLYSLGVDTCARHAMKLGKEKKVTCNCIELLLIFFVCCIFFFWNIAVWQFYFLSKKQLHVSSFVDRCFVIVFSSSVFRFHRLLIVVVTFRLSFIVIVIKTWNLSPLPKLFLAETKKLSTSSKRPSYFTCKKQALSRKILKVWKFFS